jgi:hypothetical protein
MLAAAQLMLTKFKSNCAASSICAWCGTIWPSQP